MSSTRRRYELTDFEWAIIEPLLPNKPRGVLRVDDRKVLNGIYLAASDRVAVVGDPRALWPADHLLQPFRPVAETRRLGPDIRRGFSRLRRRSANDRQLVDQGSPARRDGLKKGASGQAAARCEPDARCVGRSRGGLTTKIHAVVDAEGRPITLALTPGQAHDGRSAAGLLETIGDGDILLGDRAYDADWLRADVAARGGHPDLATR